MQQATSSHTQACMEAWLNCENLLITLKNKQHYYSQQTLRVVNECADICLTVLHALKAQCRNLSELALLCIGICEECADICDSYNEQLFKTCAAICRYCSNAFTPLAVDSQ